MRALPSTLALLAALLAVAPFVAACIHGDDTGDCSGQVIDVGDQGLVYYVITGNTPDQGWGYIESNGVPGLQRGGCGGPIFGGSDPCQTDHPAGPDVAFY